MIIGITGTDGAGKGAVVDYLVNTRGFAHLSAREAIGKELAEEGIEPTRNNLRLKANEMRARDGNDVIVKKAFSTIMEDNITHAVIESLRAVAEAKTLKEKGGVLLAVDADPKLRYQRVSGRRSHTDQVSFEEFLAHEKMEMDDPDPHGMQKAQVMQLADHTILNNGSFGELHREIDDFLKAYGS